MDYVATYSLTPDPDLVETCRGRSGLAVAEIAGRDSIAALAAVALERDLRVVVPTSVVTGTEYGDPGSPERAVAFARSLLAEVEFTPLLRIGDPRLWRALNGRYARVIGDRFGLCSPCLACHLYMHLCRVPLARALGGVPVIAGERESHDGRIKLSQTPLGIDIYAEVLGSVDMELLQPLRHASDTEIAKLLGEGWPAESGQLECVHSENYADLEGIVSYDQTAYATYAESFLRPAGMALAAALVSGSDPDYTAMVRAILGDA